MAAVRKAWRARRLFDGVRLLDDRIVVAEGGIVSAILSADAALIAVFLVIMCIKPCQHSGTAGETQRMG